MVRKSVSLPVCMVSGFLRPPEQGIRTQDRPNLIIDSALLLTAISPLGSLHKKSVEGTLAYDMFPINATAAYEDIFLIAKYRLYSKASGGMLKQGWLGYCIGDHNEIQLGLVPFRIHQYNSNNGFFNLRYYLRMEDDHDMGVKFIPLGSRFEFQLPFFKNAEELEFGNCSPISLSGYSYEMARTYKEVSQLNAIIVYKTGERGLVGREL